MHGVTLATTLLRYTPVPTAVMVAAVKGTVTSLERDRTAHMMNTETLKHRRTVSKLVQ